MKKVVLIGAGGHGRDVLDVIDACNRLDGQYEVLGFVVDPQYGAAGAIINDKPILGGFDWLEKHGGEVHVTCAVGPSQHRYQLVQRASALHCRFINLIHPSVIMTRWISLGEGVVVMAGSILSNQIQIGSHVHVNVDSTIGHDAVLRDFVTLSPGVHISGNVTIGAGCFVGTGANIIEKLSLGEWSIVGAGSAIVRDVPANSTVVGMPGKVVHERQPGWHRE